MMLLCFVTFFHDVTQIITQVLVKYCAREKKKFCSSASVIHCSLCEWYKKKNVTTTHTDTLPHPGWVRFQYYKDLNG